MNRKLIDLVKASFFALPFALPAVALAQSAGGSSSGTIGATDNTSTRQNTSTTTTTQTGTYDDNNPMGADSRSGTLGIDRDGNSTSDNSPVPRSDMNVKRKTVQRHIQTSNDDGTTTTSDSTSSTTTSDDNPR